MYIDTILEEIKSYLASALHLFELLPSSTQSYKAQSHKAHSLSAKSPNVQPHRYHVFRLNPGLLLRPRQLRIRHENSILPLAKRRNLFQLSVQNVKVKTVFTTETRSAHFQPNILKIFQVM